MRRRIGIIALAALLAAARDAEAADAEPLAITYDAPATCPDSTAFFGQIAGRTTKVRAPKNGEKARAVHVRVAKNGAGFIGHLHFEDAGSKSSPRAVEGGTCADVVEALGLITALALDPKASTAPAAALPAAAAPAAPEAAPEADPPRPEHHAPPAYAIPPGPTPKPVLHPSAGEARPTRFGVGFAMEGSSVAGLVGAARLHAEVSFWNGALVSPSIRASIARSGNVDQAAAVGSAILRWTVGAIEGCPISIALRPSGSIDFRPCAAFALGALDAMALGVATPRERSRPWLAVEALGRLTWHPLQIMAVELDLGVSVPLTRETFFFEPGVDIYQAPILAAFGRLGAGVRF